MYTQCTHTLLHLENGLESRRKLVDDASILFTLLRGHGHKLLTLLVVPKRLDQIPQCRAWRNQDLRSQMCHEKRKMKGVARGTGHKRGWSGRRAGKGKFVHGVSHGFPVVVVLSEKPFRRDVIEVEKWDLDGAALAVDVLELK